MTATLWFIGLSTGRSLINAAFPVWMGDLGRDIRLVGRDLPPGSPRESYRALVAGLRADPGALGAVITTHKVAVARAAGDLIDSLDPLAAECGEINSISRTPNRLAGFARDPLSVGRVGHGEALRGTRCPAASLTARQDPESVAIQTSRIAHTGEPTVANHR